MTDPVQDQAPTRREPATRYSELWQIVTHPAFRLGFVDALKRAPFAHDRIVARIRSETPEPALKRLGFDGVMFGDDVALAQYRYEEGRLAHLALGLRCRAWGHPDYPPASIRAYISQRAEGQAVAL